MPPGTVVVTKDAYNGYLRNEHEIVSVDYLLYLQFPLNLRIFIDCQPILGKRVVRPASFPDELIKDIVAHGNQSGDSFETISANTMSTDCFYEGKCSS